MSLSLLLIIILVVVLLGGLGPWLGGPGYGLGNGANGAVVLVILLLMGRI